MNIPLKMSPNPSLIPIVLVQSALCFTGFIMNGFFVFIVIKNSQLRTNSCGLFLLVLACCDFLSESSLILLPPILHLSNTTIPLFHCFLAELMAPFADTIGFGVIFLISVDRLLCVLIPVQYQRISTKHKFTQVFSLVFLLALFSLYMLSRYYNEAVAKHFNQPVYCLPTDFMNGDLVVLFYNIITGLVVGALANYTLFWFLIRKKKFADKQNALEKRITKSIFTLMGIIFWCMLPPPFLRTYFLPILPIGQDMNYVLQRFLLLLWKLASALEVPALYFSSVDYRAAMNKELGLILKFVCKNRNIAPMLTYYGQNGQQSRQMEAQNRKRNEMITIAVNNFVIGSNS